MILVDDLLLLPVRGIAFVVKRIHEAAERELQGRADAIRNELRELYMMLEAGRISEEEFEAQERRLLDRLSAIESSGAGPDDESEKNA
jgi:uncharacterized membrane protein